MSRVFSASSLAAVLHLAAGIDAGLFGGRDERRVLVVADVAPAPEVAPTLRELAGFEALRRRFDEVISWNELISPLHPAHWVPPAAEEPMLARLVGERLGLLDDPAVELVLEAPDIAPGAAIGTLVGDCPVTAYSADLTGYGPSRAFLPAAFGTRVTRVVRADTVPDVTPLLLSEYGVERVTLAASAICEAVATLPVPAVGAATGAPMIIGQRLSDAGLADAAAEDALYADLLAALAERGAEEIVFRPDPLSTRPHARRLQHAAERLGVRLHIADDGLPAESWIAALRPALVVSCCATELFTARSVYGCAVATMGTGGALATITPYENEQRIPLTLADAVLPRLSSGGVVHDARMNGADADALITAVGYCMRSGQVEHLRPRAAAYLEANDAQRYFKKRRLEALRLSARTPSGPVPVSGPVESVSRRILAATVRRRTARR